MRKVKMTSFKAKLKFTVARIDLIFNEFNSKVKRECNYKILVFNYILFAAQKEEMAENTVSFFCFSSKSGISWKIIILLQNFKTKK